MLSIEEHLAAVDWEFKNFTLTGEHGAFHWALLDYDVDIQHVIPPPAGRYRILVTSADDSNITDVYFAKTEGWSSIEKFAISDYMTGALPELSWSFDSELVILAGDISDDEIRAALPAASGQPRADHENSWRFLEQLSPYLYVHQVERQYFATPNKSLIDRLLSSEVVAAAKQTRFEFVKDTRLKKYQVLGTEVGTEGCVVEGCENLRIKLAVKCYLHQMESFGGIFG